MPGFSNIQGTHRRVRKVGVKVDGRWRNVARGWVKVNGQWRLWFGGEGENVVDTFTRRDAISLGNTETAQLWEILRGSWVVSAGTARATSPLAGYPLASVQSGLENFNSSMTVTGGTGFAFWIENANNWWAAVPVYTAEQESYLVTINCATCRRCISFAMCYACPDGSYNSIGCGFEDSGIEAGFLVDPYSWGRFCGCEDYTYVSCQPCDYATAYRTRYKVRLLMIKMVNGQLQTIENKLLADSLYIEDITARHLSVSQINGQITVKVFKDKSMAVETQLGTTATYSGPNPVDMPTTQGMLALPSSEFQGYTTDNIVITGVPTS